MGEIEKLKKLYFIVGSVTKWRVFGMFATAEKYRLIFIRHISDRYKIGPLMGAVAKGLFIGFAAGTPEIGFAGFNGYCIGCF